MFDASNTRHLNIEFKAVAVENKAKSLKEGRPIYDQQERVYIQFVGDKKRELVAPAHEQCVKDPATQQWVTYAQLFHRHYEAFQSGQALIGEGTPVEDLPFLDAAKRAELKALNIHTAEALATLEGSQLTRLGMFGRELKNKAQAYIERAKDSAVETRLAAENAQLKARLEALEAMMLQQARSVTVTEPMQEEEVSAEEAGSIFEAWDDAALKAFIKEQTGAAPKGQPSHATLVRIAEDAQQKSAA